METRGFDRARRIAVRTRKRNVRALRPLAAPRKKRTRRKSERHAATCERALIFAAAAARAKRAFPHPAEILHPCAIGSRASWTPCTPLNPSVSGFWQGRLSVRRTITRDIVCCECKKLLLFENTFFNAVPLAGRSRSPIISLWRHPLRRDELINLCFIRRIIEKRKTR